jgi:dTDP-4-dehydrorhamnose reductase
MKILLFGKNGQVGWELQRALAPLGELIALDIESQLCGDFTDPEGLARTVRYVRPDVIVNAAAHTAVDKAESEPGLARIVNAISPGVLASEAAKVDASLVHYSTDYVFDGSGTTPRAENENVGPLNVYGQTKLEGEELIRRAGGRAIIFRTSWVYGTRGSNFAKTMLKLAAQRESLEIIDDQFGAPTGADLIADITAHAIHRATSRADLWGLYHLVALGETTWYEYAQLVFKEARQRGIALKIISASPVSTSAYPTPAKRPLNSRLETRKLRDSFDLVLPRWETGVIRMLDELYVATT